MNDKTSNNTILTDGVVIEASPTRIRIINSEQYAESVRAEVAEQYARRDIRRHERAKERRMLKHQRILAQWAVRLVGIIMFLITLACVRFAPEDAGAGAAMTLGPLSILFLIAPVPKL